MIIGGYQPLTMIDFPGKIASIVFTKGCVFRCPFCHNPELVEPTDWDGIVEDEFFSFLKKRRAMLDGVVITGGEPTIYDDLPKFIEKIKSLGYAVKLDTNGITPNMVRLLVDNQLIDYVAMDIKHTWNKYQLVAQVPPEKILLLENCKKTMEILRSSRIPYEWRSTIYPELHTEDDIDEMVRGFLPGERYYLQEMRYATTLRKNLDKGKRLDLDAISSSLRKKYPDLVISTR